MSLEESATGPKLIVLMFWIYICKSGGVRACRGGGISASIGRKSARLVATQTQMELSDVGVETPLGEIGWCHLFEKY